MYLNADVPKLTSEGGIAAFCRGYLGHRLASTKPAGVLTRAFVKSIEAFLQREGRELVRFQKGQRKDALLQQKRRRFKKPEGVLFVGVAQEKVRVPRTPRKACPGGGTLPWSIYATALVNVYYCYCRDQAFGPFFLKFCSSFPYSAKLGLNGQEYLKCQLAQRGMAFQALDNGRLACADLPVAQRISDELSDTHRYRLTTFGLKTALFYTQAYQRLLRRGLSERHDPRTSESSTLAINFTRFQVTPDAYLAENMAA